MSFSLPRLLLPVLLALAFVARWEPTRTIRLALDERTGGQGAWLIDDPRTCEHLRRVEVAAATDKVVVTDTFLAHPHGAEVPALPVLDTLLASVAQRFLRSPEGDVAMGFVDEAALEDLAVKLPPILGLLAVLATYAAARQITTGPRRDVAALVAAALVAFFPATVGVTAAGVLDAAAIGCVLQAFLVRATARSLESDRMPAALLDALVAGAVSGLLVATTALGLFLFLPVWAAFVGRAWRASGEARANALRSGIFFSIVAALLARMPLSEGPWEESTGLVRGWLAGTSLLVFGSCAPFVVMSLRKGSETPRAFRTAVFVAVLVALAWQAPSAWTDLAPPVRAWGEHLATWRALQADPRDAEAGFDWAAMLGIVLGATTPLLRDRRSDPTTRLLVVGAITACVAAFLTPLARPYAVVACALLVARALDHVLGQTELATWRRVGLPAGIAVLALGVGLAPYARAVDRAQREERIDFVDALRWMRANTESGGAWNSPHVGGGWGVFASVTDGALVLYHARRPVVASPWSLHGGLEARRALDAAAARGPEAFVRHLRGQQIHYVLLPGRTDRLGLDLRLGFEWGRVLEILRAESPGDFRRVFTTQRVVGARGRAPAEGAPGWPVATIFALERPRGDAAPSGPTFAPR